MVGYSVHLSSFVQRRRGGHTGLLIQEIMVELSIQIFICIQVPPQAVFLTHEFQHNETLTGGT